MSRVEVGAEEFGDPPFIAATPSPTSSSDPIILALTLLESSTVDPPFMDLTLAFYVSSLNVTGVA